MNNQTSPTRIRLSESDPKRRRLSEPGRLSESDPKRRRLSESDPKRIRLSESAPTRLRRLSESAPTRFPNLAGRTGTLALIEMADGSPAWVLVVWDQRRGEFEHPPAHTWLPPGDVEPEFPPLDPSDPNAPAP